MRLLTSDMPLPGRWLWLIVVGLVALSGSAMVVSVGVLLLILGALVVPMFAITIYSTLRNPNAPAITSCDASASTTRDRLWWECRGVDVHRWENEGGALT